MTVWRFDHGGFEGGEDLPGILFEGPSSVQREPQHFLNFFPLPQGHEALRPTLAVRPMLPGDGGGLAAGRTGSRRSRLACSPNCLASPGRPLSSHILQPGSQSDVV